MTEPRTIESGRLLMNPEAAHIPGLRAQLARIEAEAREGYVPAALSPEWHAELGLVAAEAVAAERARIRAAVEELAGKEGYLNNIVSRAAVLALLEDDSYLTPFEPKERHHD